MAVGGVGAVALGGGGGGGLKVVVGGGLVAVLGGGTGLSISGRGWDGGRVTRLGLRDLLCRTVVVGSPLVALTNTAVRSSHPRE